MIVMTPHSDSKDFCQKRDIKTRPKEAVTACVLSRSSIKHYIGVCVTKKVKPHILKKVME